MWKVMHFFYHVIPAHRSGVASSGINDFSAQEWAQPIIVGESEQMETTNCMFMLTSISIWVTSILYFGSQHSVGKRPVHIRGGCAERCRLVKNCFFLLLQHVGMFYRVSWKTIFSCPGKSFYSFSFDSECWRYLRLGSFEIIMGEKWGKLPVIWKLADLVCITGSSYITHRTFTMHETHWLVM